MTALGGGEAVCGDRYGFLEGQVWVTSPTGSGSPGGRGLRGVRRGRGANALACTPVVPYAGAVPDGGRQGSTAVAAVIGPHRLVA